MTSKKSRPKKRSELREFYATGMDWVRGHYPKLKFRDSHRHLTFTVTQTDIDNAVPKDPLHCAYACALERAEGYGPMIVMRRSAWLVHERAGFAVRYLLSEKLRRAIKEFDLTGNMPAGTYTLSPVNPSNRMGARRHDHSGKGRRVGGNTPRHILPGLRTWIAANR